MCDRTIVTKDKSNRLKDLTKRYGRSKEAGEMMPRPVSSFIRQSTRGRAHTYNSAKQNIGTE